MSARFLSTPSARRATPVSPTRCWTSRFLSTPSARRATSDDGSYLTLDSFLSTPSARRATCNTVRLLRMLFISIHALREEGDRCARLALWMADNFYPRPPRGGRHTASAMSQQRRRFLSTPSARRATSLKRFQKAPLRDFYPRPPRGGRRCRRSVSSCSTAFLSTPSARRATAETDKPYAEQLFLSTPSARRATVCKPRRASNPQISIHALREEGDRCQSEHT